MADLPLDQIILGDNVETLRTFPSASIDLVVTSPPYDTMRKYGGHSWNFVLVAEQLARVIKPGGVIVWNVADETIDGGESGTSFRQALHFMDVCGLRLHDTMIYHKSNPMPLNKNRYEQAFEFMFVFSNGTPKRWNPIKEKSKLAGLPSSGSQINVDGVRSPKWGNGNLYNEMKVISNVWTFSVGGSRLPGDHPAIFPEALPRDHILTWTNDGEIVLDPFSGSGTTAEMARNLGRRYIGLEINPEYVEISRKRMAQQLLFGAEGS